VTTCPHTGHLGQSHQFPQFATMSAVSGTFRGTPNRRGQVPFADSPSSIPRPKLESTSSQAPSDMSGTSTMSASRQKQSKRDEVRPANQDLWSNPKSCLTPCVRLFDGRWKRTSARRSTSLLALATPAKHLLALSSLSNQARRCRSSPVQPSPRPLS